MTDAMKKIRILWVAALLAYQSSGAQVKPTVNLDLEKLTFKEDPKVLIQNRRKSADQVEPLSTLPAYTVYDARGYTFGPIKLETDCYAQFLLNSVTEKKIVGMVIGFETEATSKAINRYIFQKYRAKPIVLEKEVPQRNKHNRPTLSSSAYLWPNVRPGVSMILAKGYNQVVNGKTIETSELIFIDNNAKSSRPGGPKLVLDCMKATYRVNHDHD
jgi:hypothetical protein